jgi:hypothetical protein
LPLRRGGPRTKATRAMALVTAQKFWERVFRIWPNNEPTKRKETRAETGVNPSCGRHARAGR